MLRSRLTVFLMIRNGALYKSVKFSNYKYIGDPLNSAKIFNDFEADELFIVDISTRDNNNGINWGLLKNISSVCRMPVCYGGGIENIQTIEKIIALGIEKVSLCTSAFNDQKLIENASNAFGKQSIVGCIDLRRVSNSKNYEVFTNNGTKPSMLSLVESIKYLTQSGVGEIIVNNISKDGTYTGFDTDLLYETIKNSDVPLTILGGICSLTEIKKINDEFGPLGIAASSWWCFHKQTEAVLLNYPENHEKQALLSKQFC